MIHPRRVLALTFLALVTASLVAFAHGGGLDSKGGHYNRKTGEYHYHRQPAQAAAPPARATGEVLSLTPGSRPGASPSRTLTDWDLAPAHRQLEALIAALKARGVVTQVDLELALMGLPAER